MPKQKEQKERQQCPSQCVVCGEAATGYHYEAPSCTSCKTFFRRTVLTQRVYTACFKAGACKAPNEVRGKLCRACRFERCVAGGMNPRLIISLQNPDDNPVVQTFYRKRSNEDEEAEPSPSTSRDENGAEEEELPVVLKKTAPSVFECKLERIIGGLLYLENAHQRLRASPFSPLPIDGDRLDTVLAGHSRLSLIFQDGLVADAEEENRRSPFICIPDAKKLWPFADLFFALEYLKTFEFFHYLTMADKKALARHVVIICAHLTLAYFSYEKGSDVSLHPDGTRPHGGRVPRENAHEWQLHHGIIRLLRELDMDRKEYVLLKALIVCNPAIEDLSLSYKHELERERRKYSRALTSYVMARRGAAKGPSAFTAMMAIVDTLTHIMKRHKEFRILEELIVFISGGPPGPSLYSDIFD